ncbi:MAG: hypothetical protein ABSA75_14245 [Candidatus Bathyarchaeia archaeon]
MGAVLVLAGFSSRLLDALSSLKQVKIENKYVYIVLGTVIIALGVGLFFWSTAPSTITVSSGYINVQSPSLSFIPFIGGEKNVTSNEIATAYVGQIGSGNFTLSKQYGYNDGDTNIGVFTLGNKATAYVASINSTDLIIQLNNGQYVILGTSNTNELATSFSQNVYQLKPT